MMPMPAPAANGGGMDASDPWPYSYRWCEFESLANSVVMRVREGSLPPDDAYWWARAVCEMAHKVTPPPNS